MKVYIKSSKIRIKTFRHNIESLIHAVVLHSAVGYQLCRVGNPSQFMSFPSQSPTLSRSGHWRCYGNWNTKCHCRHCRLGHGDLFLQQFSDKRLLFTQAWSLCCNCNNAMARLVYSMAFLVLGKWNLILLTSTRTEQISVKANPVPIGSPYPQSGSELWIRMIFEN